LLWFTGVFWPAIWLLNKSAAGFLALFGMRLPAHVERVHAPEELLMLLSESRKHGLVEETGAQMIAGVFDLARTSVRQAMTPRTEMEAVERGWPFDRVLEVARRSGYSRLPVYEEDLDHIVGLVLVKDLLDFFNGQSAFSIDVIMREPFFIPETMRVDVLMKALQERNAHMAIVVDEYGGTLGLVTLEDLIEEIVGEIFDEFDLDITTEAVQTTAEGHLSIPGDLPIAELNERYHLDFPQDDYVTAAGLVLAALEHVPSVGEHVQIQGVTFRVTAMDHLRIERLEMTLPPTSNGQSPSAPEAPA
jgi:CBS domain containing-hemolysin-like protein